MWRSRSHSQSETSLLPAGEVLHVPRVHEDHVEAAGVEDLEDRDPINARRFHRHVCHATRREPVGRPNVRSRS